MRNKTEVSIPSHIHSPFIVTTVESTNFFDNDNDDFDRDLSKKYRSPTNNYNIDGSKTSGNSPPSKQ